VQAADMYAAIDALADRLDHRQVKTEKLTSHHRDDGREARRTKAHRAPRRGTVKGRLLRLDDVGFRVVEPAGAAVEQHPRRSKPDACLGRPLRGRARRPSPSCRSAGAASRGRRGTIDVRATKGQTSAVRAIADSSSVLPA
jgi:hypothetical protein